MHHCEGVPACSAPCLEFQRGTESRADAAAFSVEQHVRVRFTVYLCRDDVGMGVGLQSPNFTDASKISCWPLLDGLAVEHLQEQGTERFRVAVERFPVCLHGHHTPGDESSEQC